MAKNEQVRIDLVAKDDASKTIDKVADKAEDLEKLDPEIEVTADTSKAVSEVDQLISELRGLSKADQEIVLKARSDAARAELQALQSELKQTGEKAEDTVRQLDRIDQGGTPGGGARGNAIADLTGPLGGASSAAGDFAGVMDGLDDIVGDVIGKLGGSDKLIGQVSSAFGALGIVVAAGAAAFGIFKQRAEEARRRQEELMRSQRELNKAIREGDRAAAAADFAQLYDDAFAAAQKAGIPTKEFVDYITGASDVLPSFEGNMRSAMDALANTEGWAATELGARQTTDTWETLRATIDGGRETFENTNDAINEQDDDLANLETALFGVADASKEAARQQREAANRAGDLRRAVEKADTALDDLKGALDMEDAIQTFQDSIGEALDLSDDVAVTDAQIREVKRSIISLGETAGANPAVIKAQVESVTADNLWEVAGEVTAFYQKYPPKITLAPSVNWGLLRLPAGVGLGASQGNNPVPTMVQPPANGGGGAPAPTVNVTQVLPRGWRGDIVAEMAGHARRSGGLYRRTRR